MTSAEPAWIEDRDRLALHDRLLAIHGGAAGGRVAGLLQSAIGRAWKIAAYDENADVIMMAAADTAGIIKNQPFLDGNKRIGFMTGNLCLESNGYCFKARADAAAGANAS